MRMCGHAHHDDMLYLGRDPQPSWDYPPLERQGYVEPRAVRVLGGAAIRFGRYAARLEAEGVITTGDLDRFKREAEAIVDEQARAIIDAPWPEPHGRGTRRVRGREAAARARRGARIRESPAEAGYDPMAGRPADCRRLDPGPPFDPKGRTFLEAIMLGIRRRARGRSPRVRVRRGRRRQVRQRVPAAAAAARASSAIASSTRRWPRAPSSASASARRWRGSGRSARCSSTISSRPASISSSTTPPRFATGGAAACRWSCACRSAGCATPVRTTRRIPKPGSTGRRAEDRGAVDAARRARRSSRRPSPIPDPVLYYEHIALYRDPRIKQALGETRRPTRFRSAAPRCGGRATTWRSSRTARTSTSRCGWPSGWRRTASRRACSICGRLVPLDRRRAAGGGAPLPPRAHRPRGFANGRRRREPGRDHPGRGVRVARRAGPHRRRPRHARCRTRRRSKSSTCPARRRSSARPGCSPRIKPVDL